MHLVFLWPPQKLIGITHDPGPPEFAHPVDHLSRLAADEREVAAVHNAIHSSPRDIRDYGLERRQVSVDIRDDCDPHVTSADHGQTLTSVEQPSVSVSCRRCGCAPSQVGVRDVLLR